MSCFIATASSTRWRAVAGACPPLAGEAARRADAALARAGAPAPFDVAAARAEFAGLMAGA